MTTNNTKSYPGHTLGEFWNYFAFAALKADGSVVTWGHPSYGGDSSSVASKLDGTVVDVTQIYSTGFAFAALKADGSVVTWGDPSRGGDSSSVASKLDGTVVDVTQIYSSRDAFAALKADGSVVTWGNYGGDSSSVASKLDGTVDVMQIYSTGGAFAALKADGSVVTWGYSSYGGDSSSVANKLDGTVVDVTQIYSTDGAFAALKADGSVVTWGDPFYGGNSSSVASKLDGTVVDVTQIYSTVSAFAALKADGSVVTWGDSSRGGDSSSVASKLDGTVDVTQIYSAGGAFAAVKADGSVVTWGDSSGGGDSSSVASQLVNLTQIYSNGRAFAALKADGSVVTWGDSSGGGDSSSVASQLVNLTQIYSNGRAFAALKADGSVVTWGDSSRGGDSSSVASKLDGTVVDVTQIYSSRDAFAALKADGSVVTWGDPSGGNSSAVASQLSSGVVSFADINTDDFYTATPNNLPTGSTYINDITPELGQILTASNDLVDADGLGAITYQWYAEDSLIGTGGTYAVTASEVGKTITVTASYTDGLGKLESVSSAATALVVTNNHLPTGSAYINDTTPELGQILTASNDLSDADGLGAITYQWKAGDSIVGVGGTYAVTASEVGKTITVTASYTDGLGKLESVSSAATEVVTSGTPLLSAYEMFEKEGLTPGDENDDRTIGALEAGKIKVMADFSKAAYHLKLYEDPVINDYSDNSDEALEDVLAQGWKPLDLGIPTTEDAFLYIKHQDGNNTLTATKLQNGMNNGFYNNGNVAAFVARSEDAVVISFRGTNDYGDENPDDSGNHIYPDRDDWSPIDVGGDPGGGKAEHYAFFDKLISKLNSFVDDRSNGISKVFVTGHSLGGAMATHYMETHPANPDAPDPAVTYSAVTFAAPPYGSGFGSDSRITHFEINGDPVPDAPGFHPGRTIQFVGNQTTGVSSDYHSMDYYRQMVYSVDNAAWDQILKETGNQSVYIGGQKVGNDFIVDGRQSWLIDPISMGDEILTAPRLSDYDVIYGGRGKDTLTGAGGDELLLGGSDNDTLKGLTGNDRLYGDGGNDMLYGGFSLDSGIYIDHLYGGSGDDTYTIYHNKDIIIENAEEGTDTVESYLSVDYTLPANFEKLTLHKSTNATGNERENTLTGNDGKNTLKGMDNIDFLYGNGGADTLIGGQGADQLNGGLGRDIFRFESITESGIGAGNRDIIMDFNKNKSISNYYNWDRIDLSAIDANSATAGDDVFIWKGFSAFTHVAGELHYFIDSGNAIVEGDINADGFGDFQIELTGIFSLVKSDFVV